MIKAMATLSPALQRGLKIFFVLCALITLLDVIVLSMDTGQAQHWWHFFGFYSLYGFVACVVLVLLATGLRRIIMRKQDYYD